MAKSQVKIKQTAGRDALEEFAHLNYDILFGEIWTSLPIAQPLLLSMRMPSILSGNSNEWLEPVNDKEYSKLI